MTTALWLWALGLVAIIAFIAGAECCWRAFVRPMSRPEPTYVDVLRDTGARGIALRHNTPEAWN